MKHFRPGDPEFDEIAKQITPIHKVRKTLKPANLISDEAPTQRALHRRGEDRDISRG